MWAVFSLFDLLSFARFLIQLRQGYVGQACCGTHFFNRSLPVAVLNIFFRARDRCRARDRFWRTGKSALPFNRLLLTFAKAIVDMPCAVLM